MPEEPDAQLTGLLVDWGGVMTTNLFAAFAEFCQSEGLEPQALVRAFQGNETARELLVSFEEGRIEEAHFERDLGSLLGVASPEGLIDRLFSGAQC